MYSKYYEFYELFASDFDLADKEKFSKHLEKLKELEEKDNLVGSELAYKNGFIDGFEIFVQYISNKYGINDERIAEKKSNIDEKKEIEKHINDFVQLVEKFKEKYNSTKLKLVLEDTDGLEVTDTIKGLDVELRELNQVAEDLIREMDEFKLSTEKVDFSMSVVEIKNTIKTFKNRLKELKQNQIDKYNVRVEATNRMIDELKNKEGLEPEVVDMIQKLEKLTTCSVTIGSWTDFKYLNQIDYNKLVEVNKLISDIQVKIGVKKEEVSLEDDIIWIENKVSELENAVKTGKTKEEIDGLRQELINISNRVVEFNTKLHNSKSELSYELFDEYLDRISDTEIRLTELNGRIDKLVLNECIFEKIKNEINTVEKKINNFDSLVDSAYGKVNQSTMDVFNAIIISFEKNIQDIKNEIEEEYSKGNLEENQYNQLQKMVQDIEKSLEKTRDKIKNPEIVKNVDIFEFLNGSLDGVEVALNALEVRIDLLEKPIKDKNVRKQIDAQFKRIEADIKEISSLLEKHKDDDYEKYQATKERLNNAKEKLNKLGKDYRKKCPFLVKAVKSAKAFYKKHKKVILITAGLAAMALLGYHVLIPAIMQGNIMIGVTTPALRGVVSLINNILGGVIGATRTGEIWKLASGVIITPSTACTSLLKGLAMSGVGTATLVTPLIIAIKKLTEKVKFAELKEKMKLNEIKSKIKIGNKTENSKKSDSKATEMLAKLLRDYRKSGLTLEEFCTENMLSDEMKNALQSLDSMSKELNKKSNKTGREGR